VQLSAAHLGIAENFHFVDARRAQQEGALHADAMGGQAPHGEVGIVAALAHADDDALEFLDALFVAFDDAQMHADVVPRLHGGDLAVDGGLNGLDKIGHGIRSLNSREQNFAAPTSRAASGRDYTTKRAGPGSGLSTIASDCSTPAVT